MTAARVIFSGVCKCDIRIFATNNNLPLSFFCFLFQDRFKAAVIGITVLTDYNNNTYRIDDVDFSLCPTSTFLRKGEQISYEEYYRAKYQITIKDRKQPLLVSRSKARDRRAGAPELVCLIPELCRSTGKLTVSCYYYNVPKNLAWLTDFKRNDLNITLQV